MKLAVATFNGRIAPRLEFSTSFEIFEIENGRIVRRYNLNLPSPSPDMVHRLRQEGVDVVLCGGVNWQLFNLFRCFGIEVIWGLMGPVDDVVNAYLTGTLPYPMPFPAGGMGWRWRKGRKWWKF